MTLPSPKSITCLTYYCHSSHSSTVLRTGVFQRNKKVLFLCLTRLHYYYIVIIVIIVIITITITITITIIITVIITIIICYYYYFQDPEILQTKSNSILTAIVHGMKKDEPR